MRVLLWAVLGLYLLTGAAWTVLNLGSVSAYGDTHSYLAQASNMEVDSYRGFLYPLVIAAGAVLTDSRDLVADYERRSVECVAECPPPTPSGLTAVELWQIAVSVLAIAYFLFVFASRPGQRIRTPHFLLLLAILALDPLVSHFNLSILTDGLSLAAALTFVAALTGLVIEPRRPRLAAVILVASTFVVVGLRPEKRFVVGLTMIVLLALWHWRGSSAIRRRGWAAAGLVVVGLGAAMGMQWTFESPASRAPVAVTIVHQRIGYPHMSEIRTSLPEHWQAKISVLGAALYDKNIRRARSIVDRATDRNAELTYELTRDVARVALREKWAAISIDILKDSAENFMATISFYTRLGLYGLFGTNTLKSWGFRGSTSWTYTRLADPWPMLSKVYLWLAFSSLVLAAGLTAASVGRRGETRPDVPQSPSESPPWQDGLTAKWAPILVFAAVNGVAFASTADLINVRYVLFAHVAFVAAIYSCALHDPSNRVDLPSR